ncbi:MAG: DUF2953 domain-containing protein [Lachnospira sp.]
MISILLLILKIIGIIIVSVLGLALFLVLIVLFVPIRYNVFASYYDKIYARVDVSWLLRILRFKLVYDSELSMKAKVLFFTLYDNNAEEKPPKSAKQGKKQKTKKHEKTDGDSSSQNVDLNETGAETEDADLNNSGVNSDVNVDAGVNIDENVDFCDNADDNAVDDAVDDADDNTGNANEPDKKQSVFKRVYNKLRNIFETIKEKISEIIRLVKGVLNKSQDAADKLKDKVKSFSETINNEDNRKLLSFLIEQLKKLLKILKPGRCRIKGRIGFDDPATTGQLFMYVSVIQGLLGINIGLVPDFENEVKEGEIRIKGSFMLIGILVILIKVYFNKQFRKFIGN